MFSYANSLSERLIGRTQSFISSAMVLVGKLEREKEESERADKKQVGRTRSVTQYIRKVAHIARKWD